MVKLDTCTPEFKLLLTILNGGPPQSMQQIDWQLFLKQAKHHRVFPVLYKDIIQQRRSDIPDEVVRNLEVLYKKNVFNMLRLGMEMEQLNQLFHAEKIRMIQLKGPEMGSYLYGDLSLRTSGDLDIFISLKDLERAEQLLLNFGYIKDDYIESVLGDWKWRHHHVAYLHPEKKMKVELHWRLHPGPGKEPGFECLWQRKQSISDHAYLLGKEDYFYFLVHHGARHGWSRLRWLMDIKQFLALQPDWIEMRSNEYQHYSRHIAGQSLILINQLFKIRIPDEALPFVDDSHAKKLANEAMFYLERMINLHNLPLDKEVSAYHRKHLYALMSRKQKIYFAASTLYPYPEDVHTLPLPKQLHLLYFPLRPVLWIWRKSKGPAVAEGVKT
ncbi:nucleotidyltransferase family protein [Jeotgalibacillus malaysiensis]|uniref:nucleotidyltransferase domain-containing protein n=1 Tax=Jeotgalibacillus malaysiensis TaxID=1508404 RepID=UPI00384D4C32